MLEWKRRFQITTLAFSTLKAKPQDKKWNSFFFSFFFSENKARLFNV